MISIIDGLCSGLLAAPIILYYLDQKMQFAEQSIGFILFCFFFLKGIGQNLIEKYERHQSLFKCWSLLSSLAICIVPFLSRSIWCGVALVFSFPMWNYCRVQRKRESKSLPLQVQENDIYWEHIGIGLGICVSSLSFLVISTRI